MKKIQAALAVAGLAGLTATSTYAASLDIPNTPTTRPSSSVTITANVVNRSRKDVTSGTVVFDNEYGSCTASFGAIQKLGGSASASCTLDGYALTAKAVFYAADGTQWAGIAGNGTGARL
jgi:hypothetical protein